MKRKISLIITLLFALLTLSANADTYDLPSPNSSYTPWSIMFYGGALARTNLLKLIEFNYRVGGSSIYSLELTREIPPDNFLRRFLRPVVSTISLAGMTGYVDDPKGPIFEIDPYILFRWEHFPWDKYIVNTYAVGEGVSYDTRVSTWERHDSTKAKPFLNYLAFETTLALPSYPRWQLVLRVHHRSGAWGLYGAGNVSSNFVGGGLRYYW